MKISVLCPEVKKMSMARESADKYLFRANKIIPTELKEFKVQKDGDAAYKVQKEEELILKKISDNEFVIVLDERGKSFRTLELSKKIETLTNDTKQNITFVIGGPYGLGESVKKRANLKVKLSDFTFNSEVAIVVFCEQLYRMFTVISGHPYHNE